jgi:UDP-N-acetylmuramyl tripeptide synthase
LGSDGTTLAIEGLAPVSTSLGGLYNAWNTLAAVAAARVLGAGDEAIRRGLAGATPAFGRQETVEVEGRRVHLLLVKNPAGANQVIQHLTTLPGPLHLAFLLNDRHADGQDVSWTWDVDFEALTGRLASGRAGGDRAADAALRLRYAGMEGVAILPPAPEAAVSALAAGVPDGGTVYVILTYTALLDLRRALRRDGRSGTYS